MKKHQILRFQLSNIWIILGLAIAGLALCILLDIQSQRATATDTLPPLKTHPLPPTLARWEDETERGDYFEEVEVSPAGYLIWSQFPIKVYIQPPAGSDRSREWTEAVAGAVGEWGAYLPIEIVERKALGIEERSPVGDIVIINKQPPISLDNMVARSAEASYEFYKEEIDNREILSHHFVIWLSPTQRGKYLRAAVRHEFGHALGIWGHSEDETDVMYYSQVRSPPPISARDINTLKRIYQQPTRLGWEYVRE